MLVAYVGHGTELEFAISADWNVTVLPYSSLYLSTFPSLLILSSPSE